MASPLSLPRRTLQAYERTIEPRLIDLLYRRSRPIVHEVRTFQAYRRVARSVAKCNGRWLRKTWFGDASLQPSSVRGYCAVCQHLANFQVDSSVCSRWEGRPVPWWTNTLWCPDCGLVARTRAAVHLFEKRISPRAADEIYITEQTTPLYREFLRRHPRLVGSEYLVPTTPRGESNEAGIRCEDLTGLTFPDARFDHLLSFEVMEHIPDYQAALRECARVLEARGKAFLLGSLSR